MRKYVGKPRTKSQEMLDELYDANTVASAMDCTGLIQTLPQTEDELDSYAEIYDMPKPNKQAPVLEQNKHLADDYLWH
jgi:hypothetical protein